MPVRCEDTFLVGKLAFCLMHGNKGIFNTKLILLIQHIFLSKVEFSSKTLFLLVETDTRFSKNQGFISVIFISSQEWKLGLCLVDTVFSSISTYSCKWHYLFFIGIIILASENQFPVQFLFFLFTVRRAWLLCLLKTNFRTKHHTC